METIIYRLKLLCIIVLLLSVLMGISLFFIPVDIMFAYESHIKLIPALSVVSFIGFVYLDWKYPHY